MSNGYLDYYKYLTPTQPRHIWGSHVTSYVTSYVSRDIKCIERNLCESMILLLFPCKWACLWL